MGMRDEIFLPDTKNSYHDSHQAKLRELGVVIEYRTLKRVSGMETVDDRETLPLKEERMDFAINDARTIHYCVGKVK